MRLGQIRWNNNVTAAIFEKDGMVRPIPDYTVYDLIRLAEIHERLEGHAKAGDVDRFFEANHSFHAAIQQLAGNRWLSQLIDDTRKMLKLTRRDSLRVEGRLKQSLTEHRAILKAIRRRDANEAARLMHDHLLSGRAALAKLRGAATGLAAR